MPIIDITTGAEMTLSAIEIELINLRSENAVLKTQNERLQYEVTFNYGKYTGLVEYLKA